jgi:hypothetical protein
MPPDRLGIGAAFVSSSSSGPSDHQPILNLVIDEGIYKKKDALMPSLLLCFFDNGCCCCR